MLKRKKCIVGIDYGYSSIRAAEVELAADGTHRLLKWGTVETPEGAVDCEGKVLDPARLAAGLRQVLKESGITTRKAVTMIPAAGLVIRNFIMPAMDLVELREAAIWEGSQYMPFPVEEAAYDIIPISQKNSEHGSDTEVILIAAHAPDVEALMQAFHLAKLEIVGIDAGPLALARGVGVGKVDPQNLPPRQIIDDPLGEAAATGYGVEGGISEAIIDLGSGTTDVAIFRDAYIRVSRSFTIGGCRFEERIAERLGLELATARQIKFTRAGINVDGIVPLGDDEETKIGQAVQEVAEEMVEEIQRSLDYYRAQNGWIPIDRIIVTGAGVKMPGMVEYLSHILGAQIELADPLHNFDRVDNFPSDVEAYAGAIGLALWKVDTA